MAEANRRRIAAVLAADPDREPIVHPPAAFDRDSHQLADAFLVERRERIVREDAVLEVAGEELPLGVVTRHAECGLGEVVRAEREEVGFDGDLVRAHTRPGQLDHRSDQIRVVEAFRRRRSFRQLAQPAQLLRETDQGVHDLDERRLPGAVVDRLRCPDDRAHLHLVDLRPLEAEPAPTRAEHRVRLV